MWKSYKSFFEWVRESHFTYKNPVKNLLNISERWSDHLVDFLRLNSDRECRDHIPFRPTLHALSRYYGIWKVSLCVRLRRLSLLLIMRSETLILILCVNTPLPFDARREGKKERNFSMLHKRLNVSNYNLAVLNILCRPFLRCLLLVLRIFMFCCSVWRGNFQDCRHRQLSCSSVVRHSLYLIATIKL